MTSRIQNNPSEVSKDAESTSKSGIFGASTNLVNAIVGAGIVGVPCAFDQAGFVAGLIMIVSVAYFTTKSLQMLIGLAYFNPNLGRGFATYEDLLMAPFGKRGRRGILASMLVLTYGPLLIILKQTVPSVIGFDGDTWMASNGPLLVVVIILPLCKLRKQVGHLLAFLRGRRTCFDHHCGLHVSPISEALSSAGGFGVVLSQHWIKSTFFVGLGILFDLDVLPACLVPSCW